MPKIATVVELDGKEVNTALIEAAKMLLKGTPGLGGSEIKFFGDTNGGIAKVQVRFGAAIDLKDDKKQ